MRYVTNYATNVTRDSNCLTCCTLNNILINKIIHKGSTCMVICEFLYFKPSNYSTNESLGCLLVIGRSKILRRRTFIYFFKTLNKIGRCIKTYGIGNFIDRSIRCF